MQAGGYTTGGIVTNINLAESFGFAQGYDDYYYLAPDYIAAAKILNEKGIPVRVPPFESYHLAWARNSNAIGYRRRK